MKRVPRNLRSSVVYSLLWSSGYPRLGRLPPLAEMLDGDPFLHSVLDETVNRMRFVA